MGGLIATMRMTALLTRHDLRVSFRRFFAQLDKASKGAAFAIVGGALLIFHLLAWPAAGWLAAAQNEAGGTSRVDTAAAAGALFILPWLASQAVSGAARALYARGDLDLVLSAPVPSTAILAARCLAIAVESALAVGIFAGPFADAASVRAGARWLAIYPALAASSLFMTALGVAVAFALFRVLGPRRTRFFAQLAAALIGAVFVLSLQAAAVIPESARTRFLTALGFARASSAAHDGPLWLPVRAFMGEPKALVVWWAVSIAAFVAAVALGGTRFAVFAARAAGTASDRPSAAAGARPLAFQTGEGRALRTKEWRLLRRDPWLLSQILLQVIYALPIGALIWRSQNFTGSVAFAAGPTIVVVACQVSASFAWLVVSTEEAPELLATAPVSRGAVEMRKLQAIAPPLALLIGPPLLALGWLEPGGAALTFFFAVGAACSSAFLNFWRPMPGRRREVLRRHAQSKLVGLMEHLLSLFWALAICLALMGSVVALAPIAFAITLLYLNRPRRQPARARGRGAIVFVEDRRA